MKYIVIIMILLIFLNQLSARDEYSFWNNIRNSAYTMEDEYFLRCETVDLPGLNTQMFYREDNSWIAVDMENLTGLTYQAIFPGDGTETEYCRFRTEHDTLVAMMPAYCEEDIFPPADQSISLISDDPQGDTLSAYYEHLDLTATYFSYTDSRFIAGLENEQGNYPLNTGFIQYYFYITAIINPENVLQDSVGYAMVYASIPFVISPGLYKISGIEFDLNSIELIADIEVTVNNGRLYMACDIEDLTGDEDFGEWPSLSNSLGVDMLTVAYTLPSNLLPVDIGKPAILFIDQYVIEQFVNTLPMISDINYEINSGWTDVTVQYIDVDGNFPLIAEIETAAGIYPLMAISFDYSEPVIFQGEIPEIDWAQMTVRFSDNATDLVEEIIEPVAAGEEVITAAENLLVYPNPYLSGSHDRNPDQILSFNLKRPARIELSLYNLKGQLIECLFSDYLGAGEHQISWQPFKLETGIYFYRLSSDKNNIYRKLTVIK